MQRRLLAERGSERPRPGYRRGRGDGQGGVAGIGLHRVEAAALLHNTASQRVLERNGFARIGMAPAYLSIAGRWQDHLLFQLIAPEAGG